MTKTKKPPILSPLVPEKLSSASLTRPACALCALGSECQSPFVQPYRPRGWTGKLLIVGEAPGEDEENERRGRPFTGAAGKLLRSLWRSAGYADCDVALVNSVRCRPPGNAPPTMQQVRACRPFLLRTISLLTPEVIVGVGGTSGRALTNKGTISVTRLRGRSLRSRDFRFLSPRSLRTIRPPFYMVLLI